MGAPAAATRQDLSLRSLIPSVYLPTFLFSVGQGAVIPIVPLFAGDLGASVALASLTVGMRGVGTMLMDVPGGVLESKFGDKFVMIAGTALVAIVAIGASFSSTPLQLAALMLLMGGGWSFWQLARLAYVSGIVPSHQRGRVLSVSGGTNRVGQFIGPLIGGFVGAEFGLEAVFFVQAALGLASVATMTLTVNATNRTAPSTHASASAALLATLVDHRRVFMTAGFAAVMLHVLRQSRQVLIPLWGESIGLDVADIGIAVSISWAVDMLLFYPAGHVMDNYGRKWVAVPSLLVLSVSMAMIPLAGGLAELSAIAMLSGLGNGIGAGVAATLGADFAPEDARGEFLGIWRFVGDVGTSGGPLLIGGIVAVASLGTACGAVGALGLVGAVLLVRLVPESLRRQDAAGSGVARVEEDAVAS